MALRTPWKPSIQLDQEQAITVEFSVHPPTFFPNWARRTRAGQLKQFKRRPRATASNYGAFVVDGGLVSPRAFGSKSSRFLLRMKF